MSNRLPGQCAVLVVLLAAACVPVGPRPDDFPPAPLTPMVEFPRGPEPTPTLQPARRPILPSEMGEARTFFLLLKISLAAGDSGMITQRVLYPLQVTTDGYVIEVASADEFERNIDRILGTGTRAAILSADEEDLQLTLDGVQAAGGALWFDRFCADALCAESHLLITRIEN